MSYVCVENNTVLSLTNYFPTVPDTVSVYEITETDYNKIVSGKSFFNTENKQVEDYTNNNNDNLSFLHKTDWLILRHIREKALNLQTSLSDDEYLRLEQKRQLFAKSIT